MEFRGLIGKNGKPAAFYLRKLIPAQLKCTTWLARALWVQDRVFVTHAGRQGHEKGLTCIRVREWLARALHVHDRLFVTQAETQKRFDIYKSGGCGTIAHIH